MDHGQGLKYYITRRQGRGGLYLTTHPNISKREIKTAGGRQGLPSSVFMTTPKSPSGPQKAPPRSLPEARYPANETRQRSLGRDRGDIGENLPVGKDNLRYTELDTRRVRFSIPEEVDVVYPGNHENLRVLREQFDGISAQEEEWTTSRFRDWWETDRRHGSAEPVGLDEQRVGRQQEPIPRGILKNRGSKTLENCDSTRKDTNQAPKSFFYHYIPQKDDLDQEHYHPTRRLRILCPPPLPEIRTLYDNERVTEPTKRRVRFDTGWGEDENRGPAWDSTAPIRPVQRQPISYETPAVLREPMKPIPAYVRSEEEEARDSVVEW